MQLRDFFILPMFLPNLHLKNMISNFKLSEGFFMEKNELKLARVWEKKNSKTPDFYDKFY